MATKRKPVIRDKKESYECTESEKLNRHGEILERTSKILYGNGELKNGLVFRFDKFMDDHQQVVSDISDIKSSVSFLSGKYDATLATITTTANALERYKSEVKSFEDGGKEAEAKQKIADALELEKQKLANDLKDKEKKDKWQRSIWIVMAVFAFIGLGTNLYFNIKGQNKTNLKVEAVQDTIRQEMRYQGGVSKVTRGGYVKYNEGGLSDSVKVKIK